MEFLNPGTASLLFILFFIILLAIIGPIALRVGKLLVGPILWLYESRNYSVGFSLTGSVTPAIMAITLAGLLRRRGHRVVPTMMANVWFWFFVIIYIVIIIALPLTSPTADAVLLSLNAPMILAAPLIFIAAFGLARDVNEDDYWMDPWVIDRRRSGAIKVWLFAYTGNERLRKRRRRCWGQYIVLRFTKLLNMVNEACNQSNADAQEKIKTSEAKYT